METPPDPPTDIGVPHAGHGYGHGHESAAQRLLRAGQEGRYGGGYREWGGGAVWGGLPRVGEGRGVLCWVEVSVPYFEGGGLCRGEGVAGG